MAHPYLTCYSNIFKFAKARQMFNNMEALMKLMNIDMTRGVKATLYVTNLDYVEVALKVKSFCLFFKIERKKLKVWLVYFSKLREKRIKNKKN